MKIEKTEKFEPINLKLETKEELFFITRLIQSTSPFVDKEFGIATHEIFHSLDAQSSAYPEYEKTPALTSTIDYQNK